MMRDFLKVFSKEGVSFTSSLGFFLFFFTGGFLKRRKKKRNKKRARITKKERAKQRAQRDGRTLSPRAHLREEKRDEVVSRRSEIFFFFETRAPL